MPISCRIALAALLAACASAWADSRPVIEEPVTLDPGSVGLIKASRRWGLIEYRPAGPSSALGAGRVGINADGCALTVTQAGQSFQGGTYALQAGMTEGESLAQTYLVDEAQTPLTLRTIEVLFATSNATVPTTTELTFTVWNGRPGISPVAFTEDTDGSVLPHLTMGTGTNGTLYSLQIDPTDATQYAITGEAVLVNGVPKRRFAVGVRINVHNSQGSINPCVSGPSTARNAFPVTDNTASTCANYSQLNNPTNNWLFGIDCGPFGCPPNGGWSTFANLLADVSIPGFGCSTGCRPRGDWMLRVVVEPSGCNPNAGACCLPNGFCTLTDQNTCLNQFGEFQGVGTTCDVAACTAPACPMDYNRDNFRNLDDLSDYINDFYSTPSIPGGYQPDAPFLTNNFYGFGRPCPLAPNAPVPYAANAYRVLGYRVGFSPDGSNACPNFVGQPFPLLDNLADFITAFYSPGC